MMLATDPRMVRLPEKLCGHGFNSLPGPSHDAAPAGDHPRRVPAGGNLSQPPMPASIQMRIQTNAVGARHAPCAALCSCPFRQTGLFPRDHVKG